jgi:hypothetical protein
MNIRPHSFSQKPIRVSDGFFVFELSGSFLVGPKELFYFATDKHSGRDTIGIGKGL